MTSILTLDCYISFLFWNNKLALNFATTYLIISKIGTCLFVSMDLGFLKKKLFSAFFYKKIHFLHINKKFLSPLCYSNISRATFLLFWLFLISKVLEVYFDLCLFSHVTKVIYPKHSKHWPYTVAHTIDCVCSKMLNHGLNHGLFLSLFKRIPCPTHWIVYVLAYFFFIFEF